MYCKQYLHYLHRQFRQILTRGSNGRVYQHYNRLSVSGVVMFDVTILVTRDNGAGCDCHTEQMAGGG